MKRKTKIISLCVAVTVIVILICILVLKPKREFTVYNQSGEVIATVEEGYTLDDSTMVYCDVAITEAAEILSEKYECSIDKAKAMLWEENFQIYTYIDLDMQLALTEACSKYTGKFDCGAAVTDLQGNIVATYGHSVSRDGINYATHASAPYSSLKPLGVYAQAIEKDVINWSSTYEDTAYKQIVCCVFI